MQFSDFDVVSDHNYIFFQGKTKHSSVFGAILSILSYIVICFFAVYFSLDVVYKKNPTSYFYKKFIPDAGAYYFSNESMFHYFQLLDENNTVRIDNDAFVIIGANMYVDYFLEPYDLHKLSHWVYEKCEKDDLGVYKDIMEDKQFEDSVCIRKFYNATSKTIITNKDPNFKYPGMYHGTGTKVGFNIGYGTFILRCSNMTYRDTPCKPEEEIIKEEEKLIRVKIGMIDNDFDVTIYKEPVISYFLDVKNHLTGNTMTNNNLNFNPVEIITDDGFLFETNKTKHSFRLDFNEKITYDTTRETKLISSWSFLIQNKVETYDRTYPKFQATLANVGGASKAIFIIATIIHYFCNQYIIVTDVQKMWKTIGLSLKSEKDELKINVSTVKRSISNLTSFNNVQNNNINSSHINSTHAKEEANTSAINNNTNNNCLSNNYIKTPSQHLLMQDKQKKVLMMKELSFFEFIKARFCPKHSVKKQVDFIINFWRSKVSEEGIIKLHLFSHKVSKFLDENNKEITEKQNIKNSLVRASSFRMQNN